MNTEYQDKIKRMIAMGGPLGGGKVHGTFLNTEFPTEQFGAMADLLCTTNSTQWRDFAPRTAVVVGLETNILNSESPNAEAKFQVMAFDAPREFVNEADFNAFDFGMFVSPDLI